MKNLKVPRLIKSQQVKEKIFEAAQQLLLKKGYEYLTVGNVCMSAGVSAGCFYHHFAGKDELLAYYFVAGYEKYRSQFDALTSDDFIKNVTDAYDLYIAFCKEQSIGFMTMFYSPVNKSLRSLAIEDGGATPSASGLAKSIDFLEKGRMDGYLPEEISVKELGYELCTIVKGCIFDWCLNDCVTDVSGTTRKILTRHLQGIATDAYWRAFPSTAKERRF